MVELRFKVEGRPVGKERPRIGKNGHIYTPTKTKAYERTVGWRFLMAKGTTPWSLEGCFFVSVVFRRGDNRRADVDNVLKAILDGLKGVAYNDDAQVVKGSCVRLESPLFG
jgi:Holliday junction resolvase RusA-like endonuclease